MTQWTITKDYLADEDNSAVGLVGPSGATLTAEQIINHPDAIEFRMFDDDAVECYRGFMVGEEPLAPLDDFGMPNAGCTSIAIKHASGGRETV